MKIPKKLKIGAHTYSVEFTKSKDNERSRSNWGKTFLEDKRILIDKELPTSQIEETFLHELLHLCFHQSAINYDIDDKVALSEEQIICRLTPQLHQILEDNNLLK